MKKVLLLFLILLSSISYHPATALAVPPNPLVYDTGPLPPEWQALVQQPRLAVPRLARENVTSGVITTGTAKVVVILIQFTDVTAASTHTKSYFDNLLFSQNQGNNSLYDYYKENSDSNLLVTGTTGAAWYNSSHTMAYYGADGTQVDNGNGDIARLAVEAVQKADPGIDFSQYDTDHDGTVDHVIIVHAGQGQENYADTNTIWSHSGSFEYNGDTRGYLTNDGVYISNYTMLSEYSPMGVFAHEFGHDLGLPDLYNTQVSGTTSAVVGDWDLMDYGSWLGPATSIGKIPGHINAWGKVRLGWATPIVLNSKQLNVQVATGGDNSVYKIPLAVAADPVREYFLLEYRKKENFDTYLPGEGLIIWHIDDSMLTYATRDSLGRTGTALDLNVINSVPYVPHVAVALVQADANSTLNQSSDPFPGTKNVNTFTSPQNLAYNGKDPSFSLLNIGSAGSSFLTLDIYKAVFNQLTAINSVYNTPNPTTGPTKIKVISTNLVSSSEITLKIFNLSGELVKEADSSGISPVAFENNKVTYEYSWDGKNAAGEKVASGVYVYLFQVQNQQKAGKIAIIR